MVGKNMKILTIENFLNAPISESDPQGQQEVNIRLSKIDNVPLLAVLLTIFE